MSNVDRNAQDLGFEGIWRSDITDRTRWRKVIAIAIGYSTCLGGKVLVI